MHSEIKTNYTSFQVGHKNFQISGEEKNPIQKALTKSDTFSLIRKEKSPHD